MVKASEIVADGEPETASHATTEKGTTKRLHKATYARDKRNPGGYLIRVAGPTAARFADRVVPVTRKDDSESLETLTDCVWTGLDDESGKPVALYHFVAKPREDETPDSLPF
jgi:hypothetical protein